MRKPEMRRASFRKAAALAAQPGMPWYVDMWPGFERGRGHAVDCTADLCHELAHFLTVPPSNRLRRYYGLGHPGSSSKSARSNQLEYEASLLGIALERECGRSLDQVYETAIEHGWHLESEPHEVVLSRLLAKGLLPAKRHAFIEMVLAHVRGD